MTVAEIFRYPVKGLSPEPLTQTVLAADCAVSGDRAYALAIGNVTPNPRDRTTFNKRHYLQLMKHERLASLRTYLDSRTDTLSVADTAGKSLASFSLVEASERERAATFFARLLGVADDVRVTSLSESRFTDAGRISAVLMNAVSIINLATVRDFAARIAQPVDRLRFRANFYVEAARPWTEFELIERTFKLGSARLRGVMRISRCAATEVDPLSGTRDLPVPKLLRETCGHSDLGVYCTVEAGGAVCVGDPLST